MAPCRVIEDSDEDDGSFVITERMSPSMNTIDQGSIPMVQTSSTDPMLFRAVYEEHIGQLPADDDQSQLPVLDDPVDSHHLTSPSSALGARKLKRSKTINISSLTSISDPPLPGRKAKRTRSMKEMDDLTQITTPQMSRDAARKDPWEVPTSNASDKYFDIDMEVRSRDAERNILLKANGRPDQRTRILVNARSSQSGDRRLSSPLEDNTSLIVNRKRSVRSQKDDGLLPTLPKPKRRRVGSAVKDGLPEIAPKGPLHTTSKYQEALSVSSDLIGTGLGDMPIQVQRSMSEDCHVGANDLVTVNNHDSSPQSFMIQAITNATVQDSYPVAVSPVAQASPKSLNPVVIVTDTLIIGQKSQSDAVSVATVRSRRSSLPEMMERVDPNMKYTGDSSTIPNDTPLPEFSSGIVKESYKAKLISSSPLTSPLTRRIKRAKSEVGLNRPAISATDGSHDKATKRRRRSKTIVLGEKSHRREASIDNLSLPSLESAASKEAPAMASKIRANEQGEGKQKVVDSTYDSEETGLQEEEYQPPHSLRRSKCVPVHTSNSGVDLGPPKTKTVPKRASKATHTHSSFVPGDIDSSTGTLDQVNVIQNNPATTASMSGKPLVKNRVHQMETPMPESVQNCHNTTGKPGSGQVFEAVSSVLLQPKRRDQKTSDMILDKTNGVPKAQSVDAVLVTSKGNEFQQNMLFEIDSNKQPSLQTARTPPAKKNSGSSLVTTPTGVAANNPPSSQTPRKNSKKGPDQHSPLQSGKMPYRIGLSKRTRIAPLLKIIRK